MANRPSFANRKLPSCGSACSVPVWNICATLDVSPMRTSANRWSASHSRRGFRLSTLSSSLGERRVQEPPRYAKKRRDCAVASREIAGVGRLEAEIELAE